MNKVTAVFFSPTGTTAKYVKALAAALNENFQSIDLTDPKTRAGEFSFGEEELVIFGAPVYAGRLPLLEAGLFDRIKGNNTPAVFTVTYGNREFDDALLETKDLCERNGFYGIAAAAFVAEHTYSAKLAGGRPDEKDLAEAISFAEKIKELAAHGEKAGISEIPGNRPYKEEKRLPMHTEAAEHCSECGLCAQVCPVGAIFDRPGMETDSGKCIGCLACVKKCPRKARFVNDPALSAIREKLEPNFGGVYKKNRFFLKD